MVQTPDEKSLGLAPVSAIDGVSLVTARSWEAGLRAEVGTLSKRLLNEGRANWLRDVRKWKIVRLVQYVDIPVSPENQLLLALP